MKQTLFAILAVTALTFSVFSVGFAQDGQGRIKAQEARQSAKERIEEIKERNQQRRAELKLDICQRRQARIQNSITRISDRASRIKGVIDRMFVRVQGFYAEGQLTVENYEELETNVETAQADAEASIAALESYVFTLNCEDPNAASQLANFREAVNETKTELKDYRKALVELISSMRAAAAEENANDDSTETETENENETETETETENEGTN